MTLKPVDLLRIRQLPLLETASTETFGRLTRSALLQRFPRHAQLAMEGEICDFLYVLMEGTVELESAWNDRDSTLALLRPVSTFVLASVILDVPALMSARTLTRSQILMIPGETFRQAAREDSALAFAIAEELSGCYSGVVRTLKNYKMRSALERLANYLIAQQRRQGGGATLRLPCQKRVLASLLGMTPENLSRSFATLASHGVQVDGAHVTILRPGALSRLAKPDALIDNHVADAGGILGQADRERRRGALLTS